MKGLFSYPSEKNLYGIFNDSFPPVLDGVTLTVENYVHWLTQMGKHPCVVTPWAPGKSEYPFPVMRYFSLPIASRHPYRYGYPKLDPFIWKRVRNTQFTLIHSHCPFSSGRLGVYAKKKQNIPLIATFHSKYREDLKHSFRLMPFCVPIIMRRILNFLNACDEVWIPQAHVEDTVREYGYKGPLEVVENGNDFASIIQGNLWDYKRQAKQRLNIQENEIALLFIGQHIWEKGLDIILDTLKELKGKLPYRMNFIGTGYAFEDIKKRVKDYGLNDKVTLHGVIKDRPTLSDYYAASDIFLFPSFYDNAPLVVREAAAMGTPTILLKGSTASEVIWDGKNGLLADKNPHSIAELIVKLHNDPDQLRLLSTGAKDTLVRSWQDVVEEVNDRYDVIIKNYKK